MTIFKGAGTAIVTPFDGDGKVNFDAFERLIEFQIAGGVAALIVSGTTGEASTLTYEERAELAAFAKVKAAGRAKVIVGCGANSTVASIRLCQDAQKAGADGLLLVTPYYNKATQKGLVDHYTAIAASVDLPIILYNVPSRTGLNMLPPAVYALSKVENIVGTKESSGDLAQVAHIAALCGDSDFDIYAGNDDEILAVMALGGIGCVSVLGNVAPKTISDLTSKFAAGDLAGARKLQLNAMNLIGALFCEVSPIPVKFALNLMGFEAGNCRMPLTTLEEHSQKTVKEAMRAYGL